jgi:hypothetical protein
LIFGKSILTGLQGGAEIKEEYLRLNDFKLVNGAGQMDFGLAYKAVSKQEARLWIDLQMEKTDLQNLLAMYPEADSMLSVAKSLEGFVDCSLTASTHLDSIMDVDLTRTKATCNMRGENLVLLDGQTFSGIAKTLRFKNKNRNMIDSLSVDLVVDENQIQIFPFKLSMDRYALAVGGIQHLDMSFDYHVTVLQSPAPFKLGIDISGTMDKFKYRIVNPKYKRMDSPAISIELRDQTVNAQRELKRILDYEFNQIVGIGN